MTTLFAACLLARANTVTFTCPATPAKDVVAAIAAETKARLAVGSKVAERLLVVRLDETPAEDALAEVARAVDGEWLADGPRQVLQPRRVVVDDPALQALKYSVHKYFGTRTSEALTQAVADKAVADALDLAGQKNRDDAYWERSKTVALVEPIQLFIRRILGLIGEKAIVDLPRNTRFVYTLNATKMQRRLPDGAQAAFDQYLRDCQTHNTALAKHGIVDNSRQSTPYTPSLNWISFADKGLSSFLFALKWSTYGVDVQVALLGKDGKSAGGYGSGITMWPDVEEPKPRTPLVIDTEYKPSPEAALVGKAFAAKAYQAKVALTEDERRQVVEVFSDLEKHELLRLEPSEVPLQAAAALKKDVVVCVDDRDLEALRMLAETQDMKLETLLEGHYSPWEPAVEGRWLRLPRSDPRQPASVLPRRAISQFVRTFSKSGPTIDSVADLIVAIPDDEAVRTTVQFAITPFQIVGNDLRLEYGTQALRAYGLLDQAARAKAKSGGNVVPFGSLPTKVQAVVASFVFNVQPTLPEKSPKIDDENWRPSGGYDALRDVTTLLPDGIPSDSRVTFLVRDIASLFMIQNFGGASNTILPTTEDRAASTMAYVEATPDTQVRGIKLANGHMGQLDMMFQVGATGALSTYRLFPNFKPEEMVGVDGLPDGQRQSLKEKIEKNRLSISQMKQRAANGPIKP